MATFPDEPIIAVDILAATAIACDAASNNPDRNADNSGNICGWGFGAP